MQCGRRDGSRIVLFLFIKLFTAKDKTKSATPGSGMALFFYTILNTKTWAHHCGRRNINM